MLSTFDLTSAAGYADFLAVQAAAFLSVEAALDEGGAAEVLPDWPQRRRSEALVADLTALGRAVPDLVTPPDFDDEARLWGGLYVLEGSRLGGAVLRKSVPPELPRSFLASPSKSAGWPSFVAVLERKLYGDPALQRAGSSAIETFACFELACGKGVDTNELD